MAKETLEKRLREASSMQDVFSIFRDCRVRVIVGNHGEPKEYKIVKSLSDGALLSRDEKKSIGPNEEQRSTVYAVVPYHGNIMMQAEIPRK